MSDCRVDHRDDIKMGKPFFGPGTLWRLVEINFTASEGFEQVVKPPCTRSSVPFQFRYRTNLA